MFCTRCGTGNPEGNAFCSNCGAPLRPAAAQPPPVMPQYNPQYQGYAPAAPKKKKTGLIIGIIAGLVVLLGAAAAVYFFVLGTPVTGYWYSDDSGMAIEFKDAGTVINHSVEGLDTADYKYDKPSGKGTIAINGTDHDFTVSNDKLELNADSGSIEFKKADKDFDVKDFLTACLKGLYSNKTNAEVLEIGAGKDIISYSFSGEVKGTYVYDFDKGSGTLTFNGVDIAFSASLKDIKLEKYGNYAKAADGFDTVGFLSGCLQGFYLNKDIPEVLEIKAGGVIVTHDKGGDSTGTFSYDFGKGSGAIKMGGKDFTFSVASGVMKVTNVGAYAKQADNFDYSAYLK